MNRIEIKRYDLLRTYLDSFKFHFYFKSIKDKYDFLRNPLDCVRFIEFSYLKKVLILLKLKPHRVLDISSPYIGSFFIKEMFPECDFLKTDINPQEQDLFLKLNVKGLRFKLLDILKPDLPRNEFDFVFSVSVLEHIYDQTELAINNMVSLVKPGGHIYITTHGAKVQREEWLDYNQYSNQTEKNSKYFFQYRFCEVELYKKLCQLHDVEIISYDIFPELSIGRYEMITKLFRINFRWAKLREFVVFIVNLFFGITLFDLSGKNSDYSISNIHIVLKRKIA